jgi:hypothetical protein
LKLGINRRVTTDAEPISAYNWMSGDSILVLAPDTESDLHLQDEASLVLGDSEHSYIQIDNYAQKMRRRPQGMSLGPKRRVELPRGAQVRSYPSSFNDFMSVAEASHSGGQPRRSCLSKSPSAEKDTDCECLLELWRENSDSTVASASDHRHVHFQDGIASGCDAPRHNSTVLVDSAGAALADVIYVDRDICGFSLYEYLPHDAEYSEFASSRFARMFLMELDDLERFSRREQIRLARNEISRQMYEQEEQELDEALKLAGVGAEWLQSEA